MSREEIETLMHDVMRAVGSELMEMGCGRTVAQAAIDAARTQFREARENTAEGG